MLNKTCQNCGKKFHACSSCGLLYDWQYRYCSDGCWFKSGEKEHVIYLIKNIISGLSLNNKKKFLEILDFIEDYKYDIENYIEEEIKRG